MTKNSRLIWFGLNQISRLFGSFAALILLVQFGSYLFFNYHFPQGNYSKVWNCAFLGLGMVHYLLDGFIWKFREPFNRQAMLPYLVQRNR